MLKAAFTSPDVRFTETVDQSKAINRLTGFFIVIAASGMCDAGRIRHHLKANLWRKKNATVMMTGFQAQGSLGRILIDGARRRVRIQGEEIEVKARICQLDLYSGHADATELVAWVKDRFPVRTEVFLTHGEESGLSALKTRLSAVFSPEAIIAPQIDDAFELSKSSVSKIDINEPRRLAPEKVARLDWHNELSKLLLDVGEAVNQQADERGRAAIIRRLKRALEATKE
jgi:metallo-beta-lactamase family protein